MQKIRFIPPVFLMFGLIGALLRRVELTTVFDPASGLAERGAPVSVALILMSVAVFAAALALAATASHGFEAPERFKKAFHIRGYLTFAVMVALGLSTVVCAVILAASRTEPLGLTGISRWVFLVFLALDGFGMTTMAYSAYTLRDTPLLQIGSLMPSIFYCYWMVSLYRVNAGNPVLLEYSYPCLAFAAAAVSAYYSAGYAYGRRSIAGTVCIGLSASYLLPIAAVSPAPMALRIPMLATAVCIALNTSHLLGSLRPAKRSTAEE